LGAGRINDGNLVVRDKIPKSSEVGYALTYHAWEGAQAGTAWHAHALRYSADTEPRLASILKVFKDKGAVIFAKVKQSR